jgi:hypothetical protein
MIEASVRNVYGQPDRVSPALVDRYYELTLREGNRASLTLASNTASAMPPWPDRFRR